MKNSTKLYQLAEELKQLAKDVHFEEETILSIDDLIKQLNFHKVAIQSPKTQHKFDNGRCIFCGMPKVFEKSEDVNTCEYWQFKCVEANLLGESLVRTDLITTMKLPIITYNKMLHVLCLTYGISWFELEHLFKHDFVLFPYESTHVHIVLNDLFYELNGNPNSVALDILIKYMQSNNCQQLLIVKV